MKRYSLVIIFIACALASQRVAAQSQWQALRHGEDRITSVRFLPDGKRLVSSDFYGTIILWNTETGKPIWRVNLDGARDKNSYTISYALAMEVSPDGGTIAVSYDRGRVVNNRLKKGDEYRIGLLDIKDGQERKVLVGSAARALRLAFSPDGQLLASGGPDGVTRLWGLSAGQQVREFESQSGVSALSFSTDGRLLAVGQASPSASQVITAPNLFLFNVDSGELVQELRVKGSYVNDAGFSPKGDLLAVVGQIPYEITLLQTGTWESVRSLTSSGVGADRIGFSADGQRLASAQAGDGGGRIFVWEVATQAEPRSYSLRSGVETISFSPDGTLLAAGTEDGKVMLLRFPRSTTTKPTGSHRDDQSHLNTKRQGN